MNVRPQRSASAALLDYSDQVGDLIVIYAVLLGRGDQCGDLTAAFFGGLYTILAIPFLFIAPFLVVLCIAEHTEM